MRFLLVALLLAVPLSAFSGNGSNYTIFGIGDLRLASSVRAAGMGYASIAIADGGITNLNVPAAWAKITNTRVEASVLYEGFNSTDGTKHLYLASTNFTSASLAIPLSTRYGFTFAGGFAPYSNKDYSVFTSGSQQGIDYVLNHVGSGGLGRGLLGFSFAPFSVLSFGASLNYLFGSLDNSRIVLPTTPGYSGGKTTASSFANGVTATVSGLFSGFGTVFPALQSLTIGGVITSRGILNTENSTLSEFATETDTSTTVDGELVIPLSYGAGLSYQPIGRLLIAADFLTQLWSEGSFDTPSRNSALLGIGIERVPSRETNASWGSRIAYRLGYYHHQTYYVVNGQPITEWGVTGGLGIPISGENRMNIAVEYGERGTTSYGLIKENIIRVSLSLALTEPWFVRYEED